MRLTSGKIVSGVSFLGLLFVGSFSIGTALNQNQVWQATEAEKAQLKAQSTIEQTKAEETRRIADSYSKNQVATYSSLTLQNYTYNPKKPPKPPADFWVYSVDPSRRTLILDRFRRCIGNAYQGQFTFLANDQQACEVTEP